MKNISRLEVGLSRTYNFCHTENSVTSENLSINGFGNQNVQLTSKSLSSQDTKYFSYIYFGSL